MGNGGSGAEGRVRNGKQGILKGFEPHMELWAARSKTLKDYVGEDF